MKNLSTNSILHYQLCLEEALHFMQCAYYGICKFKADDDFDKNKFMDNTNKICIEILNLTNELFSYNPNLEFSPNRAIKENWDISQEMLEIYQSKTKELEKSEDYENLVNLTENLMNNSKYSFYKLIFEKSLYVYNHKIKGDFDKKFGKEIRDSDKLKILYQKAENLEKEKEYKIAIKIYEKIAKFTLFRRYKILAFAGLYRCEKALNLY